MKQNPHREERDTFDPRLAAAFKEFGCPLINRSYLAYWASPDTPRHNLEMVCDKIEQVLAETYPYSTGKVN